MLFDIVNGELAITEFALMTKPFCDIWDLDTTPKKENAMRLFKYVTLVCSPKKANPFFGIDKRDRPAKVKKMLYGDPNYATTNFMMAATLAYEDYLKESSPTYPLLDSGLNACKTLEDFLNNFDLAERTPSGAMLLKPGDLTKALKELPDVAKGIVTMIEKIQYEMLEDSKTRNQREIGPYER